MRAGAGPRRWLPVAMLAVVLAVLGGLAPRAAGAPGAAAEIPLTGTAVPELAAFDQIITGLMAAWRIPGGAVAVVKDGRLVLARGYGWADRESRRRVEPDSRFRLASLSKSLTAAAILKLVEEGRLRLDDRAFRLLDDLKPRGGARVNQQLDQITILNLLQHTGGWDRDQSFDPMFRSREIARAMGSPSPAGAVDIIRYMMDKPLQSAPGTRYAYSNFGYCVLGRVIEKVAGERYEDYVKARILRPAGVSCMRLGRSLPAERAPGEVRYYDFPGQGLVPSVFAGTAGEVPWPDGGWSIEAMDAHGGWIGSAVDLARFIGAVDGTGRRPQILGAESIRQMIARPAVRLPARSETWYGMGWQVRPVGGDANWFHTGSLDGTYTLMVRAHNGLTWVVLFNSRPRDADGFGAELDPAMWRAAGGVTSWPVHDLFPQFDGCR